MFFKIVVLKSFANFTGKHLSWSLFNMFAGPQNCNFIKKRLQHRAFPIKFAKFLRTPFCTKHLQWLLLTVLGFLPGIFLKKILRQRCFSVNFANFFSTSFDRTPPNDCLCLTL